MHHPPTQCSPLAHMSSPQCPSSCTFQPHINLGILCCSPSPCILLSILCPCDDFLTDTASFYSSSMHRCCYNLSSFLVGVALIIFWVQLQVDNFIQTSPHKVLELYLGDGWVSIYTGTCNEMQASVFICWLCRLTLHPEHPFEHLYFLPVWALFLIYLWCRLIHYQRSWSLSEAQANTCVEWDPLLLWFGLFL